MKMVRVIPILLLKNNGLVKTQNFKRPVYIGDPINAVRIFNEKEVDELVLLDTDASTEGRDPKFGWIKDIVSESFMPIGYGGGISNASHAKKLFDLGVEKIILNSHSDNFSLIEELANIYGSQSIVISIDVKRSLLGGQHLYKKNGTIRIKEGLEDFTRNVVNAGAGEVIIQSIDKEGTMSGYDIGLIKSVSSCVNVPVVASGGAGSIEDLKKAIYEGGASAVAAGSMFVFKGKHKAVLISYPKPDELSSLLIP